jgi:hypothetical protein
MANYYPARSPTVFKDVPHAISVQFWRSNQLTAKTKIPKFKREESAVRNIVRLDIVESRRAVYIPMYESHLSSSESADRLAQWLAAVESGKNVVIFDFDGPRDSTSKPLCEEVTGFT